MTTKANKARMIDKNEIDSLIQYRDQEGLDQLTLYEKIGGIIGRSIRRLRNLTKHESKIVIEELNNKTNGNPVPKMELTEPPKPIKIVEKVEPIKIIEPLKPIEVVEEKLEKKEEPKVVPLTFAQRMELLRKQKDKDKK